MVNSDAGLMDFIVVHSGIKRNVYVTSRVKYSDISFRTWMHWGTIHHDAKLISGVGSEKRNIGYHTLIVTGPCLSKSNFSNHRAAPNLNGGNLCASMVTCANSPCDGCPIKEKPLVFSSNLVCAMKTTACLPSLQPKNGPVSPRNQQETPGPWHRESPALDDYGNSTFRILLLDKASCKDTWRPLEAAGGRWRPFTQYPQLFSPKDAGDVQLARCLTFIFVHHPEPGSSTISG